MRRREFMLAAGTTALGLSTFPFRRARAARLKTPKILYFTRSAGYEHSAVAPIDGGPSVSEKVMTEIGKREGVEVVCTKDGRVFDEPLDQYDVIAFYTCGDLCNPESKQNTPPMSADGKKRLLSAIEGGKGFVGFHSGADSFHSQGDRNAIQSEVDPYVAMLGGEFVKHGPQQVATMTVTSPDFPGLKGMGDCFELNEEWYALKNFAKDLHVILVQETEGMQGDCYQRPPFPATWARVHGKGRVYYTSLGHRHDVWTNPLCQQIVLGGFDWAMGNVDADLTPNLAKVTPKANQLTR
ncbi:MAG TPA: ThuA domain-containing protein [Thermoguttaceae bacterium]|nr:ThuA domain-containing protein [Thermoguttaceae bacterium]